jgi:hypothetical protein
LVLGLILLPTLSHAQAIRLDDSASPRYQVESLQVLSEKGDPLDQSINPQLALLEFGLVEYKLATAEFVGQRVQLYYVVPSAIKGLLSPNALSVKWHGNNGLTDGTAYAGERRLVWTGTIQEPWFNASIYLSAQVHLSQLRLRSNEVFGFESYFELEVLP